jgi:uncharacterized protein GlcG (DUF336 family)
MKLAHTATAALTLGFAASLHPAISQAQVREEKTITLALANEAASAAVAECQAKGFAVSATVVDRAAQIKATQRADGAGPHTLDSALRKAFTSASFRANTGTMAENAQKNPAAANVWQIPGSILLAGGVPIRVGNDVVGAIGVGGAPSGSIDEECANAGIKKISDRLK